MGKKKIVIDTNNLISALGWEGNSRGLLRRVIIGKYEWYISRKQIKELCRVMDYPKFKFTFDQKSWFLELIYSVANVIDTNLVLIVVGEAGDDAILETAVEAGACCIISGDMHLRKLKEYNGIKIMGVEEFLKLS
jgi:uncharacterized protein